MPTQAKREHIDELAELLKKSNAVFIAEYRKLTVKKISDVRRRVRKAGGEIKVCKNTLMRIAMKETGVTEAPEIDFGPNCYVISYGDQAAVAKAIRDFSKEKGNEAMVIKGGVMGDKVLSKEEVFALADLPPREIMLAQTVGTIAAPLQGLVNVLSGTARSFVTCLDQIREKKEKEQAA